MWIYNIRQGTMTAPDGTVEGHGYSGQPQYKNDPTAVAIKGEGPIPPGRYRMTSFFNESGPRYAKPKGPIVCQLMPVFGTQMFQRSGFMIHGDSIAEPGHASDGCIILGRAIRLSMSLSDDHELLVLTGDETPDEVLEAMGGAEQSRQDPQATA